MYLWPAYIRLWNGMNSRIRFWQNWEFFSSVSWQTFELIKTRSCGVQTPTYPTDFHHRWWRLRHTKVRASTKAAGWGFHSEVRVLCEVLGCGFLHLRNLHEELILGSNIVVGSRCSCVAGGVRITTGLNRKQARKCHTDFNSVDWCFLASLESYNGTIILQIGQKTKFFEFSKSEN